jgi:hypothetical protein
MNPEFEYRIYDYNSALILLEKDFDNDVVSAYNSSNANQLKTDYLKFAFIHKYGGIFLDIKYICMYKFIDLLKYNNVFHVQQRRRDELELALLISHPDNYGINKAFDLATKNLNFKNYHDVAKRITGGAVLRDELAFIGYKTEYTKLYIDENHLVRLKHNFRLILKKYDSFNKENELFNLLPCVLSDYKNKILYNETEPLIPIGKQFNHKIKN